MGLWMAIAQLPIGAVPPTVSALSATTAGSLPLWADAGLWSTVARVSIVLNIVLLLGLGYVWARNYLQFRSKHTLGLLVFSLLLLAENGCALYYYLVDPTLSAWFATAVPGIAWRAMMLLHVLETFALVFLAWVTWD
jgi:hypothetical protein